MSLADHPFSARQPIDSVKGQQLHPAYFKTSSHVPSKVVPAECIEYLMFGDFFNNRWTSAISLDTEAVGVPMGIRQKSAMQAAGVLRSVKSMVARVCVET